MSTFLGFTLLLGNAVQVTTLVVKPFSRRAFRRLNRFAANTWWGWCVGLARLLYGIEPVVTGDVLPARENAIVIANHQGMVDTLSIMFLAQSKGRLGDLKWLAKNVIKFIPGVGWGLAFVDCLFLKRDWTKDRASIERTFATLVGERVPMWLVFFPEGTRLTPAKLQASRAYATQQGLPLLEHVLVPRAKGFVAATIGLRKHAAAVYDVTIMYPEGVPSLWQYMQGFARTVHVHVRRFPMAELPTQDDALGPWLYQRYREKDRLLADFTR